MALELKPPDLTEPQLRQRLEPELRKLSGPATLGDIVTTTGLPAERTEPVLRSLLDEYQGRLAVDDKGELIYSFPHGLQRRRTSGEALRAVLDLLWKAFRIVYKVGILVVLVAYFVIFLVIMLALLAAVLSKGGDSDFDFDFDLGGCGDGCGDGCFWFWVFSDRPSYYHQPQAFERRGTTPYRAKPKGSASKVPPWMLAYEFVFGEEPAPIDPLAHERELLSYVRDHDGRVTAADMASLTGESLEQADARLLNLMVRHGGDVEVSDNGSLIYTFDRLMVSAGRQAGEREQQRHWSRWWEKRETPLQLNRNSSGANWTLGFLNGFNLLWSSIILFSGAAMFGGPLAAFGPLLWWVLGPLPWLFSLLFFVIPLVRKGLQNKENAARRQRNLLRELAQRVFRSGAGIEGQEVEFDLFFPDDYLRLPGVEAVLTQDMFDDLAARWEAELEIDDEGRTGHRFERLRRELADVEAARASLDPRQFRLGAIEYDSGDNT